MSEQRYIEVIKAFLAYVEDQEGKKQHKKARLAMARYICECVWKGVPLFLAHIYTIAGRKAGGYTGTRKTLWAAFTKILEAAQSYGVIAGYETWYLKTRKGIRVILRLLPPENVRKTAEPKPNWFTDAAMARINKGGAR